MKVYKEPSIESKVISRLGRGDVVQISRRKPKGFRKVRVRYRGKRRWGYVENQDITSSKIIDLAHESLMSSKTYSRFNGGGVTAVVSTLNQGEREIASTGGDIFEVGTLTSQTVFFNAFYDHVIKPGKVLRGSLSLRSSAFTGEARFKNSPASVPGQEASIIQEFWGLGLTLKMYPTKYFWWGGGLEVAKARSVKLTLDKLETTVNEADFPIFAIASVAIGYDTHVLQNFYLSPWLRFGVVGTTDPIILTLEALVSVSFSF